MNASAPVSTAQPSPLIHPLDDSERLIQLYADTLGQSPEEICRRLHNEETSIGQYHMREFSATGIKPHVWSDQLVRFYQQTDSLIIGAAAWNRRPEKLKMRQWIGCYLAAQQQPPLDLLAIGDGVGFDSLYFAQCGHRVTYLEVSDHAFEFARRMFHHCGKTIHMLKDPADIEHGAYDVITCLDVLEHVPDPADMVANFARYLRPAGKLIVHAPFFFISPLAPTHLKANRKFAGAIGKLYRPHGFRLIDGRPFWDPIVLEKIDDASQPTPANTARLIGLRLTGLLLAVGRYWSGIHNWFAQRAVLNGDARWARQFEVSPYFGRSVAEQHAE